MMRISKSFFGNPCQQNVSESVPLKLNYFSSNNISICTLTLCAFSSIHSLVPLGFCKVYCFFFVWRSYSFLIKQFSILSGGLLDVQSSWMSNPAGCSNMAKLHFNGHNVQQNIFKTTGLKL